MRVLSVFVHQRPLFGAGAVAGSSWARSTTGPLKPSGEQNQSCWAQLASVPQSQDLQSPRVLEILRPNLWLPHLLSSCVSVYDVTALCKLNETHPNQSNSWPVSQWILIFTQVKKRKIDRNISSKSPKDHLRQFLLFCACSRAVLPGLGIPYPGKPTECPPHLLWGWSYRAAPRSGGW